MPNTLTRWCTRDFGMTALDWWLLAIVEQEHPKQLQQIYPVAHILPALSLYKLWAQSIWILTLLLLLLPPPPQMPLGSDLYKLNKTYKPSNWSGKRVLVMQLKALPFHVIPHYQTKLERLEVIITCSNFVVLFQMIWMGCLKRPIYLFHQSYTFLSIIF